MRSPTPTQKKAVSKMNGGVLLSLLLCFLTSPLSGALTYRAGMVVSKNWPAARLASASGPPLLLGPPRDGWSMAGGNCCGPPSPWYPRPLPAAPHKQPPAVADAPRARLLHIQKPPCRKSSLAGPLPRSTRQRRLLLAPPPQPNTRPYLRYPGTTLHRCNNSVSHPPRLRLLGAPLRPDGLSSDVLRDGTLAARSPPPQEEQHRTQRPTATSLAEQPPLSPYLGDAPTAHTPSAWIITPSPGLAAHSPHSRPASATLRPDGPSSDVLRTLAARSPPPQEEQPRTPRLTATSLTKQPPLSPHRGEAPPPHYSASLLQRKAPQELQNTPADVSHEERARPTLEKKNGFHHTGPLLAPVHRAPLTDPRNVSKPARNQVTRSARGALGPVLRRRQPAPI